jgi:transcriptional regulator with XRE-family HTH domain
MKTQTEAAEMLDWSPSKILRIENGQSAVAISDLLALLTIYPGLDAERETLLELAREAKRPTLATQFSDVFSPSYREWVEYEAYATTIQQYEPQVVPGMLQTDEYARSIVEANIGNDTARASRIVEARLQRSELLVGSGGPAMEFIIDEVALRRTIDSNDIHRGYPNTIGQLSHLMMMNTRGRQAMGETVEPELNPNISIQIAPFSMGPYLAMRHPFELIEFEDEDDPYMMYFENPDFDQVLRDKYEEIEKYIERFAQLKKRIPSPKETSKQIEFIIQLFREGKNGPGWPAHEGK